MHADKTKPWVIRSHAGPLTSNTEQGRHMAKKILPLLIVLPSIDRDSDSSDMYFIAPPGMGIAVATETANAAILNRNLQDAASNGEGCDEKGTSVGEAVTADLEALGFIVPAWSTSAAWDEDVANTATNRNALKRMYAKGALQPPAKSTKPATPAKKQARSRK